MWLRISYLISAAFALHVRAYLEAPFWRISGRKPLFLIYAEWIVALHAAALCAPFHWFGLANQHIVSLVMRPERKNIQKDASWLARNC
jgi:hypothetical protein